MMRAPTSTQAIILRRTNYGEADRILSLLTPSGEKISAIAKGVRRPKSKLAGGLELLAVCDVTLVSGRGNLALITSARLKTFFGEILQQFERMETAYMFIKQINTAAETVSEPEFYQLLRVGLEGLNNQRIDWRVSELWFRLHFEKLLGRGINLATDKAGARLAADKKYQYDFTDNAFYVFDQGRFTADHLKFLRLASAKEPAILGNIGGVDTIIDDCLWLMRTLES